ncbi:MAG: hypothetical protein V4547_19420 [Bacteroidota bacterium]
MKTIIFILFIFPTFCFAQDEKSKTNAPVKPSTTDCPTWNKKDKKKDKAAYFQSLRTNKTKINQQTTSNPNSYRDSKIQPNSVPQKTESSTPKKNVKQTPEKSNTEEITVLKTKTEKSPTTVSKDNTKNISSEDKKTTSEQEQKAQTADKKDITPSSSEEKKAKENDPEDQKANAQKTEKPDEKTESSKLKKKLERMSRKTTKVRRHSNAKCPSF